MILGAIALKIPSEIPEAGARIASGIWGIVGRLEMFQGQPQFVVSELRPISVEKYRELQGGEPLFPRTFTIDIETIPQLAYKETAARRLSRNQQLGKMSEEQEQRYCEDQSAEEERAYRAGSLAATSGRILSIAVHIGTIAGATIELELRGVIRNPAREQSCRSLRCGIRRGHATGRSVTQL